MEPLRQIKELTIILISGVSRYGVHEAISLRHSESQVLIGGSLDIPPMPSHMGTSRPSFSPDITVKTIARKALPSCLPRDVNLLGSEETPPWLQ